MSEEVPDHVKYPDRYAHFTRVYQTDDDSEQSDAANYISEWKNKHYTGDYILKALSPPTGVEPLSGEDLVENLESNAWGSYYDDGMAYTPDFDDDGDDRDHTDLVEELNNPVQPFEIDYTRFLPTAEDRATDPSTGGQKGRKLEEFALVPVWPRQEVARVYGMGAKKYEPHNWRRGYAWSWSLSALYRHIAAFESGESNDPESGLHHLAHAQFHLNTLMEFERLGLGTDDRPLP